MQENELVVVVKRGESTNGGAPQREERGIKRSQRRGGRGLAVSGLVSILILVGIGIVGGDEVISRKRYLYVLGSAPNHSNVDSTM